MSDVKIVHLTDKTVLFTIFIIAPRTEIIVNEYITFPQTDS